MYCICTVVKYISIYIHQHIHLHKYVFSDENTEIQIANEEFSCLALGQNLLGRKGYNVLILMYAVAISILGLGVFLSSFSVLSSMLFKDQAFVIQLLKVCLSMVIFGGYKDEAVTFSRVHLWLFLALVCCTFKSRNVNFASSDFIL